ncbi:hypothetical protein UFOVP1131_71 [uncultured Caudovirales phage]|uniref:Uncharacterized protein n=1 Tax=uncultured Caudovirales phage TaxID=2100421 RepID=A0A6J7XTD0_9CAUD|nr:hypothetical protein UFOVP966_85 [uncultured Caudovirales phage]CAB4184957.1 hypothetical protein UFOVP1131_71 [uncultured Caudovirales phage]CAB4192888.1 hypothetical protein UFOVP1245_115 [uncultured Caudovirales phage]CAB5231322.1 hypothetical protein UFOVP1582_63 [uncultured Caudovirales phage]
MTAKPWDMINPSIGRVSDEAFERRMNMCRSCEHFIKLSGQCKKCLCFMKLKAQLPHAECPVEKWGQENDKNSIG